MIAVLLIAHASKHSAAPAPYNRPPAVHQQKAASASPAKLPPSTTKLPAPGHTLPIKSPPTQPKVSNVAKIVRPKPIAPEDILCSLTVSDQDPGQVLQILMSETGANLVLLGKSDAKLTLRLKNVTLGEMIRHICALCDLSFLRVDRTYVLASADRLISAYPKEWLALHPNPQTEPPTPTPVVEHVTRTYMASFVNATQIAASLKELFTGKDLSAAAGPAPTSPDIGSQDGSKATGTSTAILSKGSEMVSRTVILSGAKHLVEEALGIIHQLDKPRSQVGISVTIHDISDNDLHDLGITWDFGSFSIGESQGKGINFGTFTRSPITISNALSALDKAGKSKLLASPNVSMLDGEKAFILIGDRISYPVLVGYSQTNAPIFSKEEERVGIYLQVSASIGEDGTVTLSLYPQVSSITGYLNVNGASYPQLSTREAQTTLRVKSGDTIVMGGLYQDDDIVQIERVPILSKIPFLGELFQHRKVTKAKSQVVITVTPTILAQPKQ